MKVLSKASEINNLLIQKATNSISKKDLVDRRTVILAAPYQSYDNGIDPLEEIELMRGLMMQKVIREDVFNVQAQILHSMYSSTRYEQIFQKPLEEQTVGDPADNATQTTLSVIADQQYHQEPQSSQPDATTTYIAPQTPIIKKPI